MTDIEKDIEDYKKKMISKRNSLYYQQHKEQRANKQIW